MKTQTRQDKIRKSIKTFYKTKKHNFRTAELLWYVQKKIGTNFVMPDTILREMRELRMNGILDYSCPIKKDMVYFILKKPE